MKVKKPKYLIGGKYHSNQNENGPRADKKKDNLYLFPIRKPSNEYMGAMNEDLFENKGESARK